MDEALTPRTLRIIEKLFRAKQHPDVIKWLLSRGQKPERQSLAILKLSNGKIDGLLSAIDLERFDYRDLLLAADFASDLKEHEKWADTLLGVSGPLPCADATVDRWLPARGYNPSMSDQAPTPAPKRYWWLAIGTVAGAAVGGFFIPGLEMTRSSAIGVLCFAAGGLFIGFLVDLSQQDS